MGIKNKKAFTLAEVLITFAIIGVVTVLTLPTLIKNINSYLETRKVDIIEKKLIQALNLLNTSDSGLNRTYNSTYDFVKELSKHMKIISICDSDEINKCFSTPVIKVDGKNGEFKEINVASISSAKSMKLNEDKFLPPASFTTADGTSFVISYNNTCSQDPYQAMKTISSCVAGFYDYNGRSLPNKFGINLDKEGNVETTSDIKSFNGANIGECNVKIGDLCILGTAIKANPRPLSTCENNMETYGVNTCCYYGQPNSWIGSLEACAEMGGYLPNSSQLMQIVYTLFSDSQGNHPSSTGTLNAKYKLNKKTAQSIGLLDQKINGYTYIWARGVHPNGMQGCGVFFDDRHIYYQCGLNCNSSSLYVQTFCVGKK